MVVSQQLKNESPTLLFRVSKAKRSHAQNQLHGEQDLQVIFIRLRWKHNFNTMNTRFIFTLQVVEDYK